VGRVVAGGWGRATESTLLFWRTVSGQRQAMGAEVNGIPPMPLPAGDCQMVQVFHWKTKKMVGKALWIAWQQCAVVCVGNQVVGC